MGRLQGGTGRGLRLGAKTIGCGEPIRDDSALIVYRRSLFGYVASFLVHAPHAEQSFEAGFRVEKPRWSSSTQMPKFVIEREVPGAGNLTDAQLRELSQKSVSALRGWVPKFSGSIATSQATRSIASTSLQTRTLLRNMPSAWAFLPTGSPQCAVSSTRQPQSKCAASTSPVASASNTRETPPPASAPHQLLFQPASPNPPATQRRLPTCSMRAAPGSERILT